MTKDQPIHAMLEVRRGTGRVGRQRIRLLKAIASHGSISSGGKAAGLNFRAAWNAVQALNNLFDAPLVIAKAGGSKGGGAEVTPLGLRIISGFEKLDAELAAFFRDFGDKVTEGKGAPTSHMIWSLGLKTSARNAFRGVVESVLNSAVDSQVSLRVSPRVTITSVVTRGSVVDLGLEPGREAVALIKSSFVILAPGDEPLRTSARNVLHGVVIQHEVGPVNDEVVLDLGDGKTLTATITRESGDSLGFDLGDPAQALIKASHVILAVD